MTYSKDTRAKVRKLTLKKKLGWQLEPGEIKFLKEHS